MVAGSNPARGASNIKRLPEMFWPSQNRCGGIMAAVGDKFECQDWRFEIVDMDGRRIDKVLATKDSDAVQ
jgi:hypothetical protein